VAEVHAPGIRLSEASRINMPGFGQDRNGTMNNARANNPDHIAMIEAANRAATFHPYVHADNNHGATAWPCIDVGGVQVYAYVELDEVSGLPVLVTSVHTDTADPGLFSSGLRVIHSHTSDLRDPRD
jgi:hypothetical protein